MGRAIEVANQIDSMNLRLEKLENIVRGMAYAIESALTSEELRDKIIKYGCKRLQDFSFQTLAKEMVNIYRDSI